MCREADRFAAAVLMQPRAFEPLVLEWGLDVLALQRAFRCSYASVTIRLAEVAAAPAPYGDPVRKGGRGRPCRLGRAARPPGDGGAAGAGASGLQLPSPSPASGAASSAGAGPSRTAPWRSRPSATARRGPPTTGGYTVMARPMVWKGKLAKVVVIAVPDADRAVLGPRVIASDVPARRRRPLAATAGPQ